MAERPIEGRTYEDVCTVGADESDEHGGDDTEQRTSAVEGFRHREDTGTERRFQQVSQGVAVSGEE